MDQKSKLELTRKRFSETKQTIDSLCADEKLVEKLVNIASLLIDALKAKRRVLIFGNGGSAADAQHFAAELAGGFTNHSRPALDVLALTTNTSNLTAIGNDYVFEDVYSRQLEAHAKSGDVAIGISTSGNARNVIKAMEQAKRMGLKTVILTGTPGGKLANAAEIVFHAPSSSTPRIQEAHIACIHTICELIEQELYPGYS